MSELDVFETRFAAAYRRYLDEIPTEVDAAAVVRTVTAAHQRPRAGAGSWSLRPAPALAWLVLLALLLAALGAAAFFIGSQPVQRLPAVVPPVSPTATTPATHTTVSEGPYIAVSANGNHTCAIRMDGTLECWGSNWYGDGPIDAARWHLHRRERKREGPHLRDPDRRDADLLGLEPV